MKKRPSATLLEHFAILPDPRIERHRRHHLSDILVIAVCAVLCGAESFPAIEDLGQARYEWLKQFLELPGGIPSPDTFNRVFHLLDPVQFQACFLSWMRAGAEATQGEHAEYCLIQLPRILVACFWIELDLVIVHSSAAFSFGPHLADRRNSIPLTRIWVGQLIDVAKVSDGKNIRFF